jgi:hypothetical protein
MILSAIKFLRGGTALYYLFITTYVVGISTAFQAVFKIFLSIIISAGTQTAFTNLSIPAIPVAKGFE